MGQHARGWELFADRGEELLQDHVMVLPRCFRAVRFDVVAKPVDKLLPDSLRFAPFDTGCRLQMALGVKREWKKRYDGSKD